ncbi:hypothetical protein GGI15_004836 [Coemansia interrupta]|uniref:Uncharacterized protein n=1 Tax=Coemansia interrupta TaxID=1126814 RepID=A0A9W8H178_9FUNG|nr:hypothetical protein GGI15_004836 [Coemansia interrupta]
MSSGNGLSRPGTPSPPHPLQRARAAAASVSFPTPQPLAGRNASMMRLPSTSPSSHRHLLQRAHSLQTGSLTPDMSQTRRTTQHMQQQGAYTVAPETFLHTPQLGSPQGLGMRYPGPQFSPGRKRQPAADATPRRIRRRLFFEDDSDGAEMRPDDVERRERQRREACAAALAVIRGAVEVGEAHIDLSELALDCVPDELAELKDLVVLTPGHMLATALQLKLNANRLARFPLAVCELTNLTTLIVSNNRITHLPPEIGNLTALRELSVMHNRLRSLPVELLRLGQLQTLSVFPNPFAPQPAQDAQAPPAVWPHVVRMPAAGVPRLSDLAARRLTRPQLAALKHRLAQCLGPLRPALGRIVGPAVEPEDGGVLQALRAQHLAVPVGHLCAACGTWFLVPAVEITVWMTVMPLVARAAPFRVRLCSRNCLGSPALASLLKRA